MKKYFRLNIEEREETSLCMNRGMFRTAIARHLGRNPSTITREMQSYPQRYSLYRAVAAQKDASRRRITARKPRKLETNQELREYIYKKLRLYWSPEQIAMELKREYSQSTDMRISHESIYSYLYILPRGELRKELLSYLRQRKQIRQRRKNLNRSRQEQIPDLISIEERPKEVADRIIPGHWEGDLLIGKYHDSALGSLVERTTRTTILIPLKKQDAVSVAQAFAREVKFLPQQMKLSMTYDRGREMCAHKLFTKTSKMKVFFAHPQSPWERGTNENTNGLVRQFFPKGTDFSKIPRKEIKRVQDLLNGRPRKVLGWQKPLETFNQLIALGA